MKILALEFSSAHRSVALLEYTDGAKPVAERSVETTDFHSAGIGLIEQLLREARARPEEIDLLAVGLGPGSYAGIRSAIAIAQGWQLGLGTKLLGISSAGVLALEAQKRGQRGEITIIIDAQRKEIYEAAFALSEEYYREVRPLRISSPAALQPNHPILGPEASRLAPGAIDLFPGAAALAEIARNRSDYLPGEKLEPIYLRPASFVKAPPPRWTSGEPPEPSTKS